MYVFYRLNSVEDLMANAGLMADAKDVLKVLPDLERLLKKFVSGIFSSLLTEVFSTKHC